MLLKDQTTKRNPSTNLQPGLPLIDWYADRGQVTTDELHFDHILPFSRGGTSLTTENVQLLCARHNLQKRDHIQ